MIEKDPPPEGVRESNSARHYASQGGAEPDVASEFAELLQLYGSFIKLVEIGYDDCVDEYINDVSRRYLLRRVIERGYAPTPQEQRTLEDLDARLRSLLIPAKESLWRGMPDSDFWFQGLPRNIGPQLIESATREGYLEVENCGLPEGRK